MSCEAVLGTADASWRILAPDPREPVAAGVKPTFSVVIPYFRGAGVIRQAVQSVLNQTLLPDEIVICDDGSPDDLEGALGTLREHVKIIRKENGGAASAMNAAARAARHEFVVQLDQDDLFHPCRLEAIAAAAMARPDIDIIATDATLEYDGAPVGLFSEGCPFTADGQRTAILRWPFYSWPAIRRGRLLASGGYNEEYSNSYDWECFMRLNLDGAQVAYVDEPLYTWRLTPESITSNGAQNLWGAVRALSAVLARSDLEPAVRATAEAEMAQHRKNAARLEARQAIRARRRDARWRSLGLALGKGFSPSTRAKAAIAVVSPTLARHLLLRRADRDPVHEAFSSRGF